MQHVCTTSIQGKENQLRIIIGLLKSINYFNKASRLAYFYLFCFVREAVDNKYNKKQTPWRREHLVTLGHSLRFYVITENRDTILFYFVPFCIFFHSVVFQLFTRQPLVYMASVNFSASVYIDPITLSSSEKKSMFIL